MATMKENVAKVTNNPIGAIVGGVAVFFAAKKLGKVQNKWALIGLTAAGVIAGAIVQSMIKNQKNEVKSNASGTPYKQGGYLCPDGTRADTAAGCRGHQKK